MTATLNPRPDLIQVTYKVLSDKLIDPEKKAKSIALGQTTDTWTPTENSGLKKLAKHSGIVVGIDERTHVEGEPYVYYLTVGYPAANTEGDIPSLLTMIFGKISLDGKIRIESLQLPDEFTKGKGPRFGIPGIRKLVKEPEKPLAMAIFKPCVGLSPNELAKMFEELSLGGMHLVKDDEILPDLAICPTEKRLEACLNAGERAMKATGRKTLYAINLTGPVSKLASKARKLQKLGAECFLFNAIPYGFGALEELSEVGVPIMAHPALGGAIGGSEDHGIAYGTLLGTLMRVSGADLVLFPSSYGTVAIPQSDAMAIKEELTKSIGPRLQPSGATASGLLASFPVPSAGIHPGLVPRILQDYGLDVIINAGGGVHGHPMGVRAGAKAFRQAIDLGRHRKTFGMIPQREFPELSEALRLWGRG